MRRLLALALLLLLAAPWLATAQTLQFDAPWEPMYAFSVGSGAVPCAGEQVLMSIPDPRHLGAWPFSIGAGVMPSGPFRIVGTSITHYTTDLNGYLLIGNTQPNGDVITPNLTGPGTVTTFYPRGRGFLFPNDGGGAGGAEMHVHGACGAPGGHSFYATIFYTLPGLTAPEAVSAPGWLRVTWQGVVAPTSRDWLGLYPVGAADAAFASWRYTSCTESPTSAVPAGACAFPVPATSGQYEVRLFASDGYTRLATSSTVTVGP